MKSSWKYVQTQQIFTSENLFETTLNKIATKQNGIIVMNIRLPKFSMNESIILKP